MNTASLSHDDDSTLELPEPDFDKAVAREFTEELSLALAHIAILEHKLQELQINIDGLRQRHQQLQNVHIRVLQDNALPIKKNRNDPASCPESITQIISWRRQVSDLSRQHFRMEQANRRWQVKYEQQQHLLDNYARCVDELQCELQRAARHKVSS